MANLLEILRDKIVIGDGAMGTYLYSLGLSPQRSLEESNLKNPDLVERVCREYSDAGAQLIKTNSFGANRFRLERFHLEDRVREINLAAAQLAKKSVSCPDVFVAGSVGPLSLRPFDPPYTTEEKEFIFREQMEALIEGGCDLIMLETFTDLPEILIALKAFQSLSSLPVIASLAVSEEGRLTSGEDLAKAWSTLRSAHVDIVGINGTAGPQGSWHLLTQVDVEPNDLISVFPNAGKPEFYEGRFTYAASPEYFARSLVHQVAEGARLIGGDYGTTPAHIAAMAQAAKELQPLRQKKAKTVLRAAASSSVQEKKPNLETETIEEISLLDRLKTEVVSVVELDSPKILSMEKFLTAAKALKEGGASAVTLADNSLAILRVGNIASAVCLRQKVGVTPLIHLACRDRNLLGLQSDLMGLSVLGFRHVLALTGDPAKAGDHPGATSVYDLNSVGLIKLLNGMNNGVNAAGRNLKGQTKFIIGCAFNPNSLNFDSQVRKLESKIAAGAQYVMTQPIFDPQLAKMTADRLKPLGIPIFIGVMPILHSRNAEFLHNEVPGIKIPEAFREKLRQVEDQKGAQLGMELAQEIRRTILEYFRGIYIITPFLRYEMSLQLLKN